MSHRGPATQQQPISSRPNLEELAAILRARKDRSGEHNRHDKVAPALRKKSVSNKNELHTPLDVYVESPCSAGRVGIDNEA
jgi:hypothetical protein